MKIQTVGQRLAGIEQRADAFVRGIAAGQELSRQQQALTGFPARNFCAGQSIERDTARAGIGGPRYFRPQIQIRRLENRGA